ncbi:hypothetical protein DYBT9275_00746 [Dyadobacter sp. CECT 9275]|uniref:DUF4302 domain-containing protein n=1 Tax=Dyadobacter helix TaxID=2822344 RepID=A0A916JAN6_9BACT|nr:DUF4302 domain-containing protein [Dyadobacter sp. CECT 9275]CAG4991409.1 hypothetical protein DYBT9275_00746 [Dyadobacter sp. CECT 9275]
MKNSVLYFFLLAIPFWSCKNTDDSVFEQSTDARLNEALASYEKELVGAPYGWNAVIYPGGGGSYGFYFKFNDQNRVTMYSDFSAESSVTSKESSYRLKAMQTPSLIFDTYSYLHVLSDPDPGVNGGSAGEGLLSDFEFTIFPDSVKTDVITLTGTKNKSRLVLTKATQAEANAFTNGDLAKALVFNNISKYLTYFKRINIAGTTYELAVNQEERTIKMGWAEGATGKSVTTRYFYNSSGVSFVTPIVNGSQTITGFTNIQWDGSKTQLSFTANGTNVIVASADKPLLIDTGAPSRWWNAPIESGGEWRSVEGFHVNGVDNAFGLENLKLGEDPYVVLIFQPGLTSTYDLFGPAFFVDGSLSLDYWYATRRPTFNTSGKITFSLLGTAGTAPTSGPMFETQKQLFDTNGYYFVQTSDKTYDMVSAKDAKAWISWFRI